MHISKHDFFIFNFHKFIKINVEVLWGPLKLQKKPHKMPFSTFFWGGGPFNPQIHVFFKSLKMKLNIYVLRFA